MRYIRVHCGILNWAAAGWLERALCVDLHFKHKSIRARPDQMKWRKHVLNSFRMLLVSVTAFSDMSNGLFLCIDGVRHIRHRKIEFRAERAVIEIPLCKCGQFVCVFVSHISFPLVWLAIYLFCTFCAGTKPRKKRRKLWISDSNEDISSVFGGFFFASTQSTAFRLRFG